MMYDLQKASIWKRASAFLFDVILLSAAAVGFAFIISAVTGYDGYTKELDGIYAAAEEKYGVKLNMTEDEYRALDEAERESYDAAAKELNEDKEATRIYGTVVNLTVIIISFGFLLSYMLLEFAVPLIIGNGQTLGKKIFGICLVRTDCVRITPVMLLIRTLLGKYTIETMVPALIILMIFFGMTGIVGTAVLGLLLLTEIILIAATPAHTPIHDLLAGTAAADMASQKIFRDRDELIDCRKKLAAEEAAKSEY